jgi:hypothetical protein
MPLRGAPLLDSKSWDPAWNLSLMSGLHFEIGFTMFQMRLHGPGLFARALAPTSSSMRTTRHQFRQEHDTQDLLGHQWAKTS